MECLIEEAKRAGVEVAVEHGAAAVRRLARSYTTPEEALMNSAAGQMLVSDGLVADVVWCARLDWSRLVPIGCRSDDGLRLVVPNGT